MNDRILITGGSGLLALNWAVLRRHTSKVLLCIHERKVCLENVESVVCDLGSVKNLVSLFKEFRPNCVIHAAGYTNIDSCEENPELAEYVNVTLASNVAKACVEQELPMVHISTDHLFSGKDSLLTESAAVSPVNVYGRTKANAEEAVLSVNAKALVIRTNFFGWGTSYRRSFSDFIIQNLRNNKSIQLFNDVFYSPIAIERLVAVTHDLIDLQANGIFHVVSDERLSKYCFGEKIASLFKINSKLIQLGSLEARKNLVKRPFDMSLSNKKVCELLGGNLGSVDMNIEKLLKQEQTGIATELGCL